MRENVKICIFMFLQFCKKIFAKHFGLKKVNKSMELVHISMNFHQSTMLDDFQAQTWENFCLQSKDF